LQHAPRAFSPAQCGWRGGISCWAGDGIRDSWADRVKGGEWISWIGPCSMVEANDSWAARVKVGGGISWIGQCSPVWSRDSWFVAAGVKAGGVGCKMQPEEGAHD